MRVGTWGWVGGWTSLTAVLALLATAIGPGPIDHPDTPTLTIHVAGGSFTMGSEDDSPEEGPAHTVTLGAFEIDQLPVANGQFAEFLNETGAGLADDGTRYRLADPAAKIAWVHGRYLAATGFERHPVYTETWQGARAYCAWRGARLPTEAEWERAARGIEGRRYPWGNELPDASRARYAFLLFDTAPVGSYPAGATPDGLLDMAGNAWQWTSSLHRPYPYDAADGREHPHATGERVARGGDHNGGAEMLRTTYRYGSPTNSPPLPVAFRCARDVP